MARAKKVTIYSEILDTTSEVMPESLHVWTSRGWTVVDDGVSDVEEEPVLEWVFDGGVDEDPGTPDD